MPKNCERPKTTIANQSLQSVYIWYAYRMDISAHGVGAAGGIAVGCRGSNPDGSCTFDELMKHIHKVKDGAPVWSKNTDIGDELFPDPKHAADQLDKHGYNNAWDFGKLFPNIPAQRNQQPSMSKVFGAVTDRIQAARQTVARQGLGNDHFVRELTSAQLMLTCATEARLSEQAKSRISEINKELKSRGIAWVCCLVLIFLRMLVISAAGS
jgi:hypothetical protein